ncbi:MAG: hypothetical protein RIT81_16790 [Deltaproteobacteria bacterium]
MTGPKPKPTTAAHLVHDANYHKSKWEGGDAGGDVEDDDFFSDEGSADSGLLLPSAKALGHPDLPEAEMRPPEFLQPLEAMKDIYMKVKGRMSRRTQELIEGVDLEDMLDMLRALFKDEKLVRSGEARLIGKVQALLKEDPGPLLLGLHDPRLTELWRLFLDDWDIWVPGSENGTGEDEEGVELFWEGEAEDDDGEVIEMMQALAFKHGEISLHVKLGDIEDRVVFDGETFYRLKSDQQEEDARP